MTVVVQNIINAVSLGSLYALMALGISLVFGIMGLINFAYGELIMVGGYTMLLYGIGSTWPAMIIAVVILVTILSLGMERLAFRPVRTASPATLLVTSFALSFLLQNLALMIMGSRAKSVQLPALVDQIFNAGSVQINKVDVITFVVTIVLLVAITLFLKRTPLGVQMRASSEDFRMARLLGVRADRVIATAFGISGLLAGAVALLFVSKTGIVFFNMGLQPALFAFIGTVIGGMDRLVGAAVGGFLLGCLSIAFQAALPGSVRPFRDAFVFGIVIAVLLFRPQGLVARRGAGRVRV